MRSFLQFLSMLLTFATLLLPPTVVAHATVAPRQIEAGKSYNFHLHVPNEKQVAVIEIRLQIPTELIHVTPNAKPGWQIDIEKIEDKVTEIRWYGGEIPMDMRDEFVFRAQAPAEPVNLIWKAQQTYANGEVSAWDKPPDEVSGFSEGEKSGPYSETTVVGAVTSDEQVSGESGSLYVLAGTALLLSLIALLKKH